MYTLLKWLHILLAITAVGANITYGIWLSRAARAPQTLSFTLRGIKAIDDRLANPAYALLLVTGLLMVFTAPLPITTPWILAALALYGVLLVVGLFGYTPTLRRQIQLLESAGDDSAEYKAATTRAARLGILSAVLAVSIIFLMVFKPALWG